MIWIGIVAYLLIGVGLVYLLAKVFKDVGHDMKKLEYDVEYQALYSKVRKKINIVEEYYIDTFLSNRKEELNSPTVPTFRKYQIQQSPPTKEGMAFLRSLNSIETKFGEFDLNKKSTIHGVKIHASPSVIIDLEQFGSKVESSFPEAFKQIHREEKLKKLGI